MNGENLRREVRAAVAEDYAEVNQAPAGQVIGGAAGSIDEAGSSLRFWLERVRDQHRRDADSIQSLLDMLPAKIPAGAASALQRLLFK